MPHYPKPFYRADRNLWYVQVYGKQRNLGHDKDEAFRRYHQIMQAPKPVASTLAAGVIEGFLDWTEEHGHHAHYDWYKEHLQSFMDSLPDKHIKTEDLRPFHVQQWIDSHSSWGSSYKRGGVTAVMRAFRWAEKLGHIDKSPVRYIEKPKAERRDNPVSPKDFTAIIAEVKDQPFRDLLQFAWESGVRPFELRTIDIRHLCLERRRIEISPDEAKGKKRWRTIRLTDTAIEIVRRRKGNRKAGRLFLNTDGNPWKNYAICNRFARLKKKLGKRWAAYDIRHGFCENGVDHLTVAELMGHANGQMVATTYSHLNRADQHLHEQLERSAK